VWQTKKGQSRRRATPRQSETALLGWTLPRLLGPFSLSLLSSSPVSSLQLAPSFRSTIDYTLVSPHRHQRLIDIIYPIQSMAQPLFDEHPLQDYLRRSFFTFHVLTDFPSLVDLFHRIRRRISTHSRRNIRSFWSFFGV
jgi:hypothetical protein